MDSSAQAKLEQVIQDLEQHDNLTKLELLQILGKVLDWLPIVSKLLAKFFME